MSCLVLLWLASAVCCPSARAAQAQCWEITGWSSPAGQPSAGLNGDHPDLVPAACVAPAPAGWAWLQIQGTYGVPLPSNPLYVRIALSDPHVWGGANGHFAPLLLYAGIVSGTPRLIVALIVETSYDNTMPFVSQPGPCTRGVRWWDGTTVQAVHDGANCRVSTFPAGSSPFIHANRFYIARTPTTQCQAGTFDSVNCYIMPAPPGSFLLGNQLYVPPGPGGACAAGTFDGANCLLASVPVQSLAFLYAGALYATPRQCMTGAFDGANCQLGTPPSSPTSTTAFLYGGAFYYHE
jgi:hypothetical protein